MGCKEFVKRLIKLYENKEELVDIYCCNLEELEEDLEFIVTHPQYVKVLKVVKEALNKIDPFNLASYGEEEMLIEAREIAKKMIKNDFANINKTVLDVLNHYFAGDILGNYENSAKEISKIIIKNLKETK